MADADFALFNDILDDIATKKQEDEDEAFFGVKLNENSSDKNKQIENPATVKFAPSPIVRNISATENHTDSDATINDVNKGTVADLSDENQQQKSDDDTSLVKNNGAKEDSPTRQISQSSIDEDIKELGDPLTQSNELTNKLEKDPEQVNSLEDENEKNEVDDENNENDDKSTNENIEEGSTYRESSDSISNIDLESYRQGGRKEIKTVSFSMQYEKFCNVLNKIETGMTGGSVSFDVDTVTNENKLLVSPTTEYQPQPQPLYEQPPIQPKRKKKKVKKKRKKTPSLNNDLTNKPDDKCYCKNCKYSVYNQSNSSPLNHMFQSNSQPPTPPTPMVKKNTRPKTAGTIGTKQEHSKMIDLDFNFQRKRTTSKLDADLKKSGNPVLIAWLKVKNEEEKERRRREKRDTKKQQQQVHQKLLKMRQRSAAATERVQEWINRKRVQSSVESRKQISPESYKSVPSEPFDYSDEKFESGISSEEEEESEKRVTLPKIVPSNRPKTSRGPKNRQRKQQKVSLISISPSGKLKHKENIVEKTKDEVFFTQTDDSGLPQDEVESEPSKDTVNERNDIEEFEQSTSESESESETDSENEEAISKEINHSDEQEPPLDTNNDINKSETTETKETEEKPEVTESKGSESDEKSTNDIEYVLSILNTQIKFGSVRDFTESIINEAVGEIEINSRLKQKRLRRPITSPNRPTDSQVKVPSPPKSIANKGESNEEAETQTNLKKEKENSFNSVKDLLNYENSLINGTSSAKNSKQTEVSKSHVTHQEWVSQKKKESKKKKEREKALNNFYHELEMKIVQDEKIRRIMEKEAAKKRVDSGLHFAKQQNSDSYAHTYENNDISQGVTPPKFSGISQQESLLRFGKYSELK